MKYFYKLLFAFCCLMAVAFFTQPSALAQTESVEDNGVRYTTSPLPVSLVTLPGMPVSTELKVRNSGSQTETFKVGLLKFTASGADGKPVLLDRQTGDDFFDWVTFSPSQFEIAPNEWKTVKMTVSPPTSAAFGYYYAVTFSRADKVVPKGQQTALLGSAATLVLLEVQVPNAKRDIQIQDFRTGHGWYEFLPVDFVITLANHGNVHAAPSGTIFISKGKTTVGKVDINQVKGNVLPDSERTFTADWADGFPIYLAKEDGDKVVLGKDGKTVYNLKWHFSDADKLRIGKYSAHLVMAYDDGKGHDVPIDKTIEFWVIPWRLLMGALVIGILVMVGLFSTGRGLWRRLRSGRDL